MEFAAVCEVLWKRVPVKHENPRFELTCPDGEAGGQVRLAAQHRRRRVERCLHHSCTEHARGQEALMRRRRSSQRGVKELVGASTQPLSGFQPSSSKVARASLAPPTNVDSASGARARAVASVRTPFPSTRRSQSLPCAACFSVLADESAPIRSSREHQAERGVPSAKWLRCQRTRGQGAALAGRNGL